MMALPARLAVRPSPAWRRMQHPVVVSAVFNVVGTAGSRRRYHVAVIGSGPAGFYSTKYLFKQAGEEKMHIDMYERLPTPFGLVRFGVAPDHPEVKNVVSDFSAVASTSNFRFFGNVEIGSGKGQVSLDTLRSAYDAVIVCSGAEGDRKVGIPGEDLNGVVGSPAFVKWYNGHPDYRKLDCENPGEAAVVVGHGNVALDAARVLAKAPSELQPTDIDPSALAQIAKWQQNGLKTIHVVGRRGFVQAAFTNAELRELLTFSDEAICVVDPEELAMCRNAASEEELGKSRMKKRSVDILEKLAKNFALKDTTSKRVIWLRFLASPAEVVAGDGAENSGSVGGLRIIRTKLEGDAGKQRAVEADPSQEREVIPCGLIVRSVGFGMTPLEGVPANEWGYVPHTKGRVEGEGNLYVSGWAKRGPTGIIASNIGDAQETTSSVVAYLAERGTTSTANVDAAEVAMAASGKRVVSFADWQKLEAEEHRMGTDQSRAAVKLTDIKEMMRFLKHSE